MIRALSLAVAFGTLGVGDAAAAVVCQRKSGALVVRAEACKRKEAPIDPVALGLQGPQGPIGVQGLQGPAGQTLEIDSISPGTAVRLESGRCYGVGVGGAAAVADKGDLLTGFLQSSSAQAVAPNRVFVVPGARNLSTQGGAVGGALICNLNGSPVDLPSGWQFNSQTIDAP